MDRSHPPARMPCVELLLEDRHGCAEIEWEQAKRDIDQEIESQEWPTGWGLGQGCARQQSDERTAERQTCSAAEHDTGKLGGHVVERYRPRREENLGELDAHCQSSTQSDQGYSQQPMRHTVVSAAGNGMAGHRGAHAQETQWHV